MRTTHQATFSLTESPAPLRDVAALLGLTARSGYALGQGSASQLIDAIARAARERGAEAVADTLRPLIEPPGEWKIQE